MLMPMVHPNNALTVVCLSITLPIVLTSCVDMTPIEGHVLSSTSEQRFTADIIDRDWAAINSLRKRIVVAKEKAPSIYAITRAESMTEFGAGEYAENDRTGIVEDTLDDAMNILKTQEAGNANVINPVPDMRGTQRIRQDLWDKIEKIKQDPDKLRCVGEETARLESGLQELAHENYEVVTKLNTSEHSEPFMVLVDTQNKVLDEALSHCHSVPSMPTKTIFSADALFGFNKSEEQDILEEGKQKLNSFAANMANQPNWQKMVITGHTDRIGLHSYNLFLGKKRADTIRSYLVKKFNLPADKIETRSLGYAEPIKECTGEKVTPELKACLQPNRRVEIDVSN